MGDGPLAIYEYGHTEERLCRATAECIASVLFWHLRCDQINI